MKKQKVSSPVIRRLPRYYRHLNDLHQAGVERISSNALGNSLGLTASQIRQDLSCFGEFGQQGYGYNVSTLRDEIADILGMNRGHTAVILGVGNLGRALMENFHFDRSGVALAAAFDVVPDLVGREVSGIPVHHVDHLEEYLAQHPASIGVLTVPGRVAPGIANRLVRSGVKGIWNFTNIELSLAAPDVVVEDVHFADSLLALSYMISEVP
ncbi:redox-sensing transcriptional repressor Rex [Intestinimonas massiliensis (ex Afouda et al. 2020)]|uniref:redox-sensing transcriptional repressor Rex n=1 Tax=Intestinimonas massiliensis (ex Afouda et al. 2020) TaxID=1673721 RepID=UPI001031350A|nr:redox-sensing transcriptional repressor Rex [Intestinimonas massiliensis (ex Afouda et al. 2020)]